MGCAQSAAPSAGQPAVTEHAEESKSPELKTMLHETETYGKMLLGYDFSISLADPMQPDCPLLAVSPGFQELTGFNEAESTGHNCRFLLDRVPQDQIDTAARDQTRQFIKECRAGMPEGRTPENMLVEQMNAKKDGTLFMNGFLMHATFLPQGNRPVIFAVQNDVGIMDGRLKEVAQSRLKYALGIIFYERAPEAQ